MKAQIHFKSAKLVSVENLKEVYAGRQNMPEPYDGLIVPGTALTFVGDTTVCCNSDDVLFITIQ